MGSENMKEDKREERIHKITTTSNGITGHLEKFCDECQRRQKEFNKELLLKYKNPTTSAQ